jgi:rSAM/selenodomain-associated transferase 2
MKRMIFPILCSLWLVDMALLAFLSPLGKHLCTSALLYLCGFTLLISMVKHLPDHWPPLPTLGFIITVGVLARGFFLVSPPSNDIYRYIWEGWVQTQGINPYLVPPEQAVSQLQVPESLRVLWTQINHKDLAAVYPAPALLLFRGLAAVRPSVSIFKLAVFFCDVGTMLLLAEMIRRRRLSPRRLLFYSANPLVLVFGTGQGHLDVYQAFCLCLGLLSMHMRRQAWGYLALGFAAAFKYLAAAAVPYYLRRTSLRKSLAALTPLLLYVPFLDAGRQLFESLGTFVLDMHFNDALPSLARSIFGAATPAALAIALLAFAMGVYLFEPDRLRAVYLALGCLLLLLPTLHPWYLLLITPLLCFFPSKAWLYLHAAMVLTFPVQAVEYQSGVFQEIQWLKWFEYLPFFALLVSGLFREGYFIRPHRFVPPGSVSVVIPAYNEAERILRCVRGLQGRPLIREIIVADGGSVDSTREIAACLGAKVVSSRRGRGIQLRAGAAAATGDVLLVLHADSEFAQGGCRKILERLAAAPTAPGGAFGMRFTDQRPATCCIAWLNNCRAALTGISFGDQAQFIRSEALQLMGGFPPLRLMEDVELALRMKSMGRVLFLGRGVRVSGRRWQDRGVGANVRTVLKLFFRYLLERRWQPEALSDRKYFEQYYREVQS